MRRLNTVIYLITLLMILGIHRLLLSQRPETPSEKPATLRIGQWVKYQIKRYSKESDEAKPHDLSEAELVISLVATEAQGNNRYFWVEFLVNPGKEQQRVVKFMIDQEGNPFPAKLILKYGNLEAVEMDLSRWEVRTRLSREMLFNEMTRGLWVIPFTRTLPSEEELTEENISLTIDRKEIQLKCLKVSIKQPQDKVSGYIWYSDQIPLAGLVKFYLVEAEYRTIFTLTGYGTSDAKSVITESPKKLDFKE